MEDELALETKLSILRVNRYKVALVAVSVGALGCLMVALWAINTQARLSSLQTQSVWMERATLALSRRLLETRLALEVFENRTGGLSRTVPPLQGDSDKTSQGTDRVSLVGFAQPLTVAPYESEKWPRKDTIVCVPVSFQKNGPASAPPPSPLLSWPVANGDSIVAGSGAEVYAVFSTGLLTCLVQINPAVFMGDIFSGLSPELSSSESDEDRVAAFALIAGPTAYLKQRETADTLVYASHSRLISPSDVASLATLIESRVLNVAVSTRTLGTILGEEVNAVGPVPGSNLSLISRHLAMGFPWAEASGPLVGFAFSVALLAAGLIFGHRIAGKRA